MRDVEQLSCVWEVKERVEGVWVVRRRVKNIFTNYGLTSLASAVSGANTFPGYLALETIYVLPTVNIPTGATSVTLTNQVHVSGDTQLVLGVGTANQETVTWSKVSGSGPYTYTIPNGANKPHTTSDPVCRLPLITDTVAQLQSEGQYDPTNFPSQRMQSPGGYSPGSGQWTVQFYFPGGTAQFWIAMAGLTDNVNIGSGNLHNHFLVGLNNVGNTQNDVEVDGTLTLINS